MQFSSQKECIEMMLRKGYDGLFRLQSDQIEYGIYGSVEKCISAAIETSNKTDLPSSCQLKIGYPEPFSTLAIAWFDFSCDTHGILTFRKLTIVDNTANKSVSIDLANSPIPKYREMMDLFPKKRAWYKRLFKPTMLLCGLIVSFNIASAQVSFRFSDLFKQNKKSLRYMGQQIAELQIYLEAVKKGYRIARSGLETVRRVRNGEFDIHNLFYTGLWKVNPELLKLPSLAQTLFHTQASYFSCKQLHRNLSRDTLLNPEDRSMLTDACTSLMSAIDANIKDLQLIITPGEAQMSDADRMRRIEGCLKISIEVRTAAQELSSQAAYVAIARLKDRTELATISNLYK